MKMSDGERLIVVMLAEVMEHLQLNREIDPAFVKKMAIDNDTWALRYQYPGIFSREEPIDEATVDETSNILAMFSYIEFSISELEAADAAEIGALGYAKFSGFDGNHDEHYGIAQTLIKDLDRFSEFSTRSLNSHHTVLPKYRRMLAEYDSQTHTLGTKSLSKAQLEKIVSA